MSVFVSAFFSLGLSHGTKWLFSCPLREPNQEKVAVKTNKDWLHHLPQGGLPVLGAEKPPVAARWVSCSTIFVRWI